VVSYPPGEKYFDLLISKSIMVKSSSPDLSWILRTAPDPSWITDYIIDHPEFKLSPSSESKYLQAWAKDFGLPPNATRAEVKKAMILDLENNGGTTAMGLPYIFKRIVTGRGGGPSPRQFETWDDWRVNHGFQTGYSGEEQPKKIGKGRPSDDIAKAEVIHTATLGGKKPLVTRPVENSNSVSKTNIPAGILRPMPKKQSMSARKATAPVAMSIQMPHREQKYNGKTSLTISHREYVGDIVSTGTTFNCSSFATLMPGDPCSYPWLSKIAASFAKFNWRKARLMYVPTCSTTTGGVVIIAFDTNAQRTTPTSKVALLEYESSCRGAPWAANSMDCKGMNQKLYSFYGNQPNSNETGAVTSTSTYLNVDIKTYSAGQIFVGLDGVSTGTVGELYLEYEVEFSEPGVWTVPPVQIHIFGNGQNSSSFFATPANTTIFSNIATSAPSSNSIVFPDFPAGQFMIFSKAVISGTETAINVAASGTGVTTLGGSWNSSSSTANTWSFFQVIAPTAVTITASGFSHISGADDLIILPYDRNMSSVS
jgi:hypothetical protein